MKNRPTLSIWAVRDTFERGVVLIHSRDRLERRFVYAPDFNHQ
jgi:hypothetical protein